MKGFYEMMVVVFSAVILFSCTRQAEDTNEKKLDDFVAQHVEQVKPLQREAALAYWEAATTGDADAYDRSSELELKIRLIYSDADDFAYLKGLQESEAIEAPLLSRQLQILYNAFLANQIEASLLKQIVELSTEIEKGDVCFCSFTYYA